MSGASTYTTSNNFCLSPLYIDQVFFDQHFIKTTFQNMSSSCIRLCPSGSFGFGYNQSVLTHNYARPLFTILIDDLSDPQILIFYEKVGVKNLAVTSARFVRGFTQRFLS